MSMRMFAWAQRSEMRPSVRSTGLSDLDGASASEPPAPGQIFTRLGVILLVALCFGAVAQVLVAAQP
jgi:hypothetical protein